MKNFLFAVVFLKCVVANCQEVSDKYILWNNNYKLKFSDFQLDRKEVEYKEDSFKIPYSYAKVEMYYEREIIGDSIEYTIFSYFDKSLSYISKTDTFGLEAQQGRFYITEFDARKLKYLIHQKKTRTIAEIDSLYNYVMYQDFYLQEDANKQIEREFIEFSKYAKPSGKVKLKK